MTCRRRSQHRSPPLSPCSRHWSSARAVESDRTGTVGRVRNARFRFHCDAVAIRPPQALPYVVCPQWSARARSPRSEAFPRYQYQYPGDRSTTIPCPATAKPPNTLIRTIDEMSRLISPPLEVNAHSKLPHHMIDVASQPTLSSVLKKAFSVTYIFSPLLMTACAKTVLLRSLAAARSREDFGF